MQSRLKLVPFGTDHGFSRFSDIRADHLVKPVNTKVWATIKEILINGTYGSRGKNCMGSAVNRVHEAGAGVLLPVGPQDCAVFPDRAIE